MSDAKEVTMPYMHANGQSTIRNVVESVMMSLGLNNHDFRLRDKAIMAAAHWIDQEAITRNAQLAAECEALKAENERLSNPQDGDIKSQAGAWCAVWDELEKTGLLSFVPSEFGGRNRAVEFIRYMASELAHRAAQLAAAQKTIAELQGREGRLREALNRLNALDLECPGMPNARDSAILFAIATLTAAIAATDGGAE